MNSVQKFLGVVLAFFTLSTLISCHENSGLVPLQTEIFYRHTQKITTGYAHKFSHTSEYSRAMQSSRLNEYQAIVLPAWQDLDPKNYYTHMRFDFDLNDNRFQNHLYSITIDGRICGGKVYLNKHFLYDFGDDQGALKKNLVLPDFEIPIPYGLLTHKNTLHIILHNQHYDSIGIRQLGINELHQHESLPALTKTTLAGLYSGVFLIAIVFNMIFFMINRKSVHLYSGMIPLILMMHLSLFFQDILPLPFLNGFPAFQHGFDVSIRLVLLPLFVFHFYKSVFAFVFPLKSVSKSGLWQFGISFLNFCVRNYIGYIGPGLGLFLILAKSPLVYQEFIVWIFWLYTVPVILFIFILLILALDKRRMTVIFGIVVCILLLGACVWDIWDILTYQYPISGKIAAAGFIFVLNYILILVFNRFRSLRDINNARQILAKSSQKLMNQDKLKNNYILASTTELMEPLESIGDKTLEIIDANKDILAATSLGQLAQILNITRRLQSRYKRVEKYFGKLNQDFHDMGNVSIKELLDYFYLLVERDYGNTRLDIQIDYTVDVKADRDLLLVYLWELFENSCLYNHLPEIKIRLFLKDDYLVLSYHDQGLAGLGDQLLDYAEVFHKGPSSSSRIGMGLSLVFRIAELHGKKLSITQDTEIWLFLKPFKGVAPAQNTDTQYHHIALLYENGMYRQACREIADLKGYKFRRIILFLWASSDIVKRFLDDYKQNIPS